MALVVSGLLNKQAGAELDISEITVKAHRGQVMRKMTADSFADLVNMAARLRIAPCDRVNRSGSVAPSAEAMRGRQQASHGQGMTA